MTEEWFNVLTTKDINYLQQHVEKFAKTQNQEGETLLMSSCKKIRNEQIVQILSEYEQGIKNKHEQTALDICIRQRTYAYIQYLQQERELEKDCKLTNLMWACCYPNNEDAVKALAEKEQGRTTDLGVTALMIASACRNHLYIQYIQKEFGMQDQNGISALIYACYQSDNEETVKILSKHECKLQFRSGTTALMVSMKLKYYNYIQYLQPEFEMQDICKKTALMIVCEESGNEEVVKILAQYEQWLTNHEMKTALMIAVENNHPEYIQYLQREIGLKDAYDKTALYYACALGYLESVKQLFDEAHINVLIGTTPLGIAKLNKHEQVVKLLENYSEQNSIQIPLKSTTDELKNEDQQKLNESDAKQQPNSIENPNFSAVNGESVNVSIIEEKAKIGQPNVECHKKQLQIVELVQNCLKQKGISTSTELEEDLNLICKQFAVACTEESNELKRQNERLEELLKKRTSKQQ